MCFISNKKTANILVMHTSKQVIVRLGPKCSPKNLFYQVNLTTMYLHQNIHYVLIVFILYCKTPLLLY